MIILFTGKRCRPAAVNLAVPRVYLTVTGAVLALAGLLLWGGYQLGAQQRPAGPEARLAGWQTELAAQRAALAAARRQTEAEMDALGQRLAQMQAAVLRLDGLGQRLVDMANLDRGEFDFGQPPAQGGPDEAGDTGPIQAPDLLAALDDLSRQLDDRQRQLNALETLLLDRRLKKEGRPSGRPVRRGWLSSPYGKRTDPFTGRPARHRGIDFAGRKGSEVVAVAAGVVTWSGPRSGYGNLVEINHGNGYVTRYGHNEKNLVKVGDRVRKGQQIARMGSSGRSTGPHVHFEVLRNGKRINPGRFIRASR